VSAGEAADVAQPIALVGVDADNRHAVRSVLRLELVKPLGIELDQRTIDAEEGEDDELLITPVAEPALGPAMVAQGDFLDRGAGRGRFDFGLAGQDGGQYQGRPEHGETPPRWGSCESIARDLRIDSRAALLQDDA